MSDLIEAALAALPKATNGQWMDDYSFVTTSDGKIICHGFDFEDMESSANQSLCAAAPDLAAEVIRLREEVARHEKSPTLRLSMLVEARDRFARPAETALLARVREKIEALSVIMHPDYVCDFVDKDAALRAVDEVEKEVRG